MEQPGVPPNNSIRPITVIHYYAILSYRFHIYGILSNGKAENTQNRSQTLRSQVGNEVLGASITR